VVCHNMGRLITETVESVWRSEFLPDELLLVDDGSDDAETPIHLAALERAAVEHGRPLRIVRQGNLGLAAARNAGLNAATGEFISFLFDTSPNSGQVVVIYAVPIAVAEIVPDSQPNDGRYRVTSKR
jgi:hypothetical protein